MSRPRDNPAPAPGWQEVALREGEQVVLNGALVTATAACKLRVGGGANVLRSKELGAGVGRPLPAHELYYAALEIGGSETNLADGRYRLFDLLGQVVARHRTHAAQEDCNCFAAALLGGDVEGVLTAARKLAAREAGRPIPAAGREAA